MHLHLNIALEQRTGAEHKGHGTPVMVVTRNSPLSLLRQPKLPLFPSANRDWCFMNPEPQQDSPINLLVLLIKHHIRKCKFPNGLPSISEVSSRSLLVMPSVMAQQSWAGEAGMGLTGCGGGQRPLDRAKESQWKCWGDGIAGPAPRS